MIDGPKGVGKTATASQRCATARYLDDASQAQVVEASPGVISEDDAPVLIDEWQRVPAVFDAVRRLVDDDPQGGRFLLTGSAPSVPTHLGGRAHHEHASATLDARGTGCRYTDGVAGVSTGRGIRCGWPDRRRRPNIRR